MKVKSFLLLTILSWAPVFATLPPEAVQILESIPGRKLTFEFVLQKSMERSESYKALYSSLLESEAALNQSDSITTPRFFGSVGWQDDKRQPLIPFAPAETKGSKGTVGVQALTSTGTGVRLELGHSVNHIRFTTIPQIDVAETTGTVTISQNLWKDFFGKSTRAGRESLEYLSKANKIGFQANREDWFLNVANLYHTSFLAQEQHRAAVEALKRKVKLLRIMDTRLKRGTAEMPDYLQVESAKLASETLVAQTKQNLANTWAGLVVGLKMPPKLQELDPAEVPINPDTPIGYAMQECGAHDQLKPLAETTAAVKQAEHLKQASDAGLARAESDAKPLLQLQVQAGANKTAGSSGDTFGDFVAAKNPLIGVGVQFGIPLSFSEERANVQKAAAQKLRADAMASLALDNQNVGWRNLCGDLFRLENSRKLLQDAFENQSQRERLEEERWKNGRSTTFLVIQAGDDATQAELNLRATETQLRLATLKVGVMSGRVQKEFEKVEAKIEAAPKEAN